MNRISDKYNHHRSKLGDQFPSGIGVSEAQNSRIVRYSSVDRTWGASAPQLLMSASIRYPRNLQRTSENSVLQRRSFRFFSSNSTRTKTARRRAERPGRNGNTYHYDRVSHRIHINQPRGK